jgi:molybdate transport system substrate-binding protein
LPWRDTKIAMNDRILSTNPVLARRAGISRAAVILTATLLLTTSLHAGQITVAAAADLKFALDELTAEFHTNQPDINVQITYGSSGSFYTQLQNQAPFDIFFSADVAYPRKLVAAGLALDTNVFLYAVGRIVVWVPKASPVDIEKLGIQSLFAPSVQKIAIANPKHAPYGVAAMAAMKSLGVYDQAEPKLVFGENVAQTVQFVESGAADIGVIALSLAVAPQMRDTGRFWEIPLNAYPKMEQGGIIMNWTKEAEAARAFRDFVLGQHGRAVLKRNGFFLPEKLEK